MDASHISGVAIKVESIDANGITLALLVMIKSFDIKMVIFAVYYLIIIYSSFGRNS